MPTSEAVKQWLKEGEDSTPARPKKKRMTIVQRYCDWGVLYENRFWVRSDGAVLSDKVFHDVTIRNKW